MAPCAIDHLTVTAPTLAHGAAFVRAALGVEMQAGGEHPRMGTHNLLLRLGDAVFLEVIAVNPAALPPARTRWFGLDGMRPQTAAALATWVARTADIHAAVARSTEDLGAVEPMTRGTLEWRITIPADGALRLGGLAPALIQWQATDHPAGRMPASGCTLVGLELHTPEPARLARLIDTLGELADVTVCACAPGTAPSLRAGIQTPQGLRWLGLLA